MAAMAVMGVSLKRKIRVIPETPQALSGTQGVRERRAGRPWVPALRFASAGMTR